MGLAEDLAALQDLRGRGELSEDAYLAARDATLAKHGANVGQSHASARRFGTFLKVAVALMAVCCAVVVIGAVSRAQPFKPTQQPVSMVDEIAHLPAYSWKTIPFTPEYWGDIEIAVDVKRGNPVDVFVTTPSDRDAMENGQWNRVRTYSAFNASKVGTFRKKHPLEPQTYYLVLRDTSRGILSARSSDVDVRVKLSPTASR